ncbi:uncharacterized protein IWZ02DRAFT_317652 [Phyllosticta citriasiana]|uniref:uncharacterized protein n=1 Tax=Phyllosticta citriasiana TaxID=595635 RepID=UPI0030FDA87F
MSLLPWQQRRPGCSSSFWLLLLSSSSSSCWRKDCWSNAPPVIVWYQVDNSLVEMERSLKPSYPPQCFGHSLHLAFFFEMSPLQWLRVRNSFRNSHVLERSVQSTR